MSNHQTKARPTSSHKVASSPAVFRDGGTNWAAAHWERQSREVKGTFSPQVLPGSCKCEPQLSVDSCSPMALTHRRSSSCYCLPQPYIAAKLDPSRSPLGQECLLLFSRQILFKGTSRVQMSPALQSLSDPCEGEPAAPSSVLAP